MYLFKNWKVVLSLIDNKEEIAISGDYYESSTLKSLGKGLIILSSTVYDRKNDLILFGKHSIKLGEAEEEYEKKYPNARKKLLKL